MPPLETIAHMLKEKRTRTVVLASCLLLLMGLSLWRFIDLHGDFPQHLTKSGELFTDEGWYTSSASRHVIGLPWLLTGDFNPAIQMPVGQWLTALAFELTEPGLQTVRALSAIMYCATAALAGLWVRRISGDATGILCAGLVLINPIGFHYSRLGITEHLAGLLALAALICAYPSTKAQEASKTKIIASTAFLTLAILTKSNFITFTVVAAFLVYRTAARKQTRWAALLPLAIPCVFFLMYQSLSAYQHPLDAQLFSSINLEARMVHSIDEWASTAIQQVKGIRGIGTYAALCLALGSIYLITHKANLKSEETIILQAMFVVFFTYIGMLSLFDYSPRRYFIPLIPAACVVTSIATTLAWRSRSINPTPWIIACACIVTSSLISLHKTSKHLSNMQTSFSTMLSDVDALIQRDQQENMHERPWVAGHFAHTLMLAHGWPGINTRLTTTPPEELLKHYKPKYLITQSDSAIDLETARRAGASIETIQSWNVLENYYGDKSPTSLYRLHWNNR